VKKHKLGIFGGAFDPPHIGHVNLAVRAMEELRLDKMLIIPTGESPHKTTPVTPFADRFEMARLAFEVYNNFEISNLENKAGKSYTIDTLRELKKLYPDYSLYLIIGGDMLMMFDKWYCYKEILELCEVVAAAREENYGELCDYAKKIGAISLKMPIIAVSSTQIRGGENIDLLPENVYNYIKARDLYHRTD